MKAATLIQQKMEAALAINHLDISNESHMHNVPAGSESHFRVVVVSEQFENLALLARHRTVNKVLADELAGPIHALALHTYTTGEWSARGEQANVSPDCHGGAGR